MPTLILSTEALVQVRAALKRTPQPDTDEAWAEAWAVVRDALAEEYDKDHQRTTGTDSDEGD